MTLSLVGALPPFPVLKTFELDRKKKLSDETTIVPATYSRATTQQDEMCVIVATNNSLIRIMNSLDGWEIHTKKEKPDERVKACCILPDGKVFVVNLQSIHLYSSSLDLLTNVLLNSFVDGLASEDTNGYNAIGVTQFKPLVHQVDAEYAMISKIADLEKIEARGIKHVHDKSSTWRPTNYLMILLTFKNGQLQYKSLEDDSFLLKNHDFESTFLELAQDMYMINNLII